MQASEGRSLTRLITAMQSGSTPAPATNFQMGGTIMKPSRFVRFLCAVIAAVVLFSPPVLAADDVPWQHQDEEFFIDVTARHDEESGDTLVGVNLGWGHYITDNQQVGAVLTGLFAPAGDGALLGPSWTYNFLKFGCNSGGEFCTGNLMFGGSGSMTTGDLTDEAAGQLATWFGFKLYQGRSAAISPLFTYTRAVEPGEDGGGGANSLDSRTLTIRVSFGAKQPAPAPAPVPAG